MCTVIVTIRAVLWYVVSLVGTLLILVALFTKKWLEGSMGVSNTADAETFLETASDFANSVGDGNIRGSLTRSVGLFLHCTPPSGRRFFEGECIPNLENFDTLFTNLDDDKYPHAWRGAVVCFVIGLGLMIITDFFALMTLCCRSCICCSVFTVCGSVQSFAGLLFVLGLIAYPAGWGSQAIVNGYCGGDSGPFMLGDKCTIGFAFWLAVAGTVCTVLASSLALWAYQSTKTSRCEARQDEGEKCICLP